MLTFGPYNEKLLMSIKLTFIYAVKLIKVFHLSFNFLFKSIKVLELRSFIDIAVLLFNCELYMVLIKYSHSFYIYIYIYIYFQESLITQNWQKAINDRPYYSEKVYYILSV